MPSTGSAMSSWEEVGRTDDQVSKAPANHSNHARSESVGAKMKRTMKSAMRKHSQSRSSMTSSSHQCPLDAAQVHQPRLLRGVSLGYGQKVSHWLVIESPTTTLPFLHFQYLKPTLLLLPRLISSNTNFLLVPLKYPFFLGQI